MAVKERIKNISAIVRFIYLYFGGKLKMENKKFQTPEFLKKHTKDSEQDDSAVSVTLYENDIPIAEAKVRSDSEVPKKMSPMEKEALLATINGFSNEQIDFILDNVPIELVYNRLGRELQRNKEFALAVNNAMKFAK